MNAKSIIYRFPFCRCLCIGLCTAKLLLYSVHEVYPSNNNAVCSLYEILGYPAVNFVKKDPGRHFYFGSLVILYVVCRYLSLFLLYITKAYKDIFKKKNNKKIGPRNNEKPTRYNAKPTRKNEKPTHINEKPTRFNEKPTRYNENPTRNNEKPARYNEKATRKNEKPTRINEKSTSNNEKPTRYNEKPTPKQQEANLL